MGNVTKEAPSAEEYASALRKIPDLTDSQLRMVRLHYYAPMRTITAAKMAKALGYNHYGISNSQYGRLGRLVGEQLDYNPIQKRLGTLVTFEKRYSEWHWIMRPQFAQAIEVLGWVEASSFILPEEIAEDVSSTLIEGAVSRIMVNAYERNPAARRRCIEAHGSICCICGFDFRAMYGEVVEGYIHVHHLRSLSEIRDEYQVDPVADLRPVCPNCHVVLHHCVPPFGIEEVRAMILEHTSAQQGAPADRSTAARFHVG